MTILPTVPVRPTCTLSFASASQTVLDDVGEINLRINATVGTIPSGLTVRFTTGGTGIHRQTSPNSADWMVDGEILDGSNRISVQLTGSGSFATIRVRVNKNYDLSETYALMIVNGPGYKAGASPTHTITCERSLTPPSASNTGHVGSLNTWGGGDKITSPGTYENYLFNTELTVEAGGSGSVFRNCRFRGSTGAHFGLQLTDCEDILVDKCTFGQEPVGAWDSRIPLVALWFYNGSRNCRVQNSRFMQIGGDCIKWAAGAHEGARVNYCFASYAGYKPQKHADFFQIGTDAIDIRDGLVEDCFLEWPPVLSDAAGANTNAVFQINKGAHVTDVHVRNCWMRWGNYYFNWGAEADSVTNCSAINCQIGGDLDVDYRTHLYLTGSNTGPIKRSGCKDYTQGGILYNHENTSEPFNNTPVWP